MEVFFFLQESFVFFMMFDGNQWVVILTATQREYPDIFATTGGF